jgi:hypothetical protein
MIPPFYFFQPFSLAQISNANVQTPMFKRQKTCKFKIPALAQASASYQRLMTIGLLAD